MLAGKMKLNHFLMIVVGVVSVGVGAFFVFGGGGGSQPVAGQTGESGGATGVQPLATPVEPAKPTATPPATSPATSVDAENDNLREVDRLVMKWTGKSLGKSKIKDAIKGKPFKVNLYQDKGNDVVNRAKIDLDRDEQWDEKWTFDGSNISRKVAPADDEDYSESYDWNGTEWVAR